MNVFVSTLTELASTVPGAAVQVAAAVPNPAPVAPPGMQAPAELLLGWMKWVGIMAGLVGFGLCALMMILGRPQPLEHGRRRCLRHPVGARRTLLDRLVVGPGRGGPVMSREAIDPTRRRATRLLIALLSGVVILVALVGLLLVRLLTASGPAASQPGPNAPTTSAQAADGEVRWVDVAGVALPVSRLHGPRILDGGRAAGYSRSEQGAALAAVQVLARTSPTAGPAIYRPVLASQVTGENVAALSTNLDDQYAQARSQATTPIPSDAPIPGNDAHVTGYLITAHSAGADDATVEVVLSSKSLPAGQLLDVTVSLVWANGDWRVVAPPNGDWGTLARSLGSAPAGLLDYREMT